MMTDEQILELVKEHFEEGGIQDDGSCCEWWGYNVSFLKFAIAIHENGYSKGYCEGYKSGSTGVFGEPLR